jgi:hypothetical protein
MVLGIMLNRREESLVSDFPVISKTSTFKVYSVISLCGVVAKFDLCPRPIIPIWLVCWPGDILPPPMGILGRAAIANSFQEQEKVRPGCMQWQSRAEIDCDSAKE